MDEPLDFPPDEDEQDHQKSISAEIKKYLALAYYGGVLAVNGLYAANDTFRLDEPKSLVSLLLTKAAQNVRFAVRGLTDGYYSGAISVLRSALEALEFASLFSSKPDEWIPRWYKVQILRMQSSGPPNQELVNQEQDLIRQAKRSLLDGEQDHQAVSDFRHEMKDDANQQIHTTLAGLANQFGIDITELVPEELGKLLDSDTWDIEQALDLYTLFRRPGFTDTGKSKADDVEESPEVIVELVGRYDEPYLSVLSSFAFYIAHRTLDLVASEFDIPANDDFVQDYKDWHKRTDTT
jgi:hypothetical protein